MDLFSNPHHGWRFAVFLGRHVKSYTKRLERHSRDQAGNGKAGIEPAWSFLLKGAPPWGDLLVCSIEVSAARLQD